MYRELRLVAVSWSFKHIPDTCVIPEEVSFAAVPHGIGTYVCKRRTGFSPPSCHGRQSLLPPDLCPHPHALGDGVTRYKPHLRRRPVQSCLSSHSGLLSRSLSFIVVAGSTTTTTTAMKLSKVLKKLPRALDLRLSNVGRVYRLG